MTAVKRTALLSLFLLQTLFVLACGNEFYRTELPLTRKKLDIRYLLHSDGNILPYWENGFDIYGPDGYWELKEKMEAAGIHFDDENTLSWAKLEKALEVKSNYKLLSDYAWYEVRTGDRAKAVRLLEALYKDHPTEYNILANLGTAYEVVGQPQKALDMLKKAVAINPASHFGSEWIHINILEQKVAANPDYRKIIGLSPGAKYDKSIPADSLMVQLAYQLHERIGFIAPPDPIVGQLVKDFADLVAMVHSSSKAQEFYAYAVKYDSTILLQKPVEKAVVKDTAQSKDNVDYGKYNTTLLLVILGVVIAGVIVYAIIRNRQPAERDA